MSLRDAWYWTKVVLLNNLLNGSPELPYYEPRAFSKRFFAVAGASAILVVVAGALGAHALIPSDPLGPLAAGALSLAALVVGPAAGVLATLRGMRLGAEREHKPASHRLFAEAIVTTDRARRRALAEEASALDPDHVGSRLLLADLHEHELGEPETARVRLTEALDAVDRAIAIKREKRLFDHHEMRLRAWLVEHVARLRA